MPANVTKYKQDCNEDQVNRNSSNETIPKATVKTHIPVRLNKKGFNAYLLSAYVATIKRSSVYRESAIKTLLRFIKLKAGNKNCILLAKLRTPKKQFLDYQWNERIMYLVLEHREVDHAMSWLSTLGGAFSALGEQFEHCAEIAGKISLRQFELALRLDDPLLVARCKLYAALSLLQRGRLRIAKFIIRNIYTFAVRQKDVRLVKMCQGVWAKLQYSYKLKRQKKCS